MRADKIKTYRRKRRKRGIRKRLHGTAERPRLTVFRSLKHIYAQIVDDDRGVTLCEASTLGKELRGKVGYGGNVSAAKEVGTLLGERAKAKKIERVALDRNGFRYGGRVRGLADAVREAGVQI